MGKMTGVMLVFVLLLCGGCTKRKPIRIGFVGGVTGRVADLGVHGRDGATLAVEQINAAGGVIGRPIQLLVRDDRQDPQVAVQVDVDLIGKDVCAIVGHMTSSMSTEGVAVANQHEVLMLSPTTSTTELSGVDDYFFRVYPGNEKVAAVQAKHIFRSLGYKRVAIIYDLGNRSYSESLYLHFCRQFAEQGGECVTKVTFVSGKNETFSDLAPKLIEAKPDCVFVIANSMDTAMICQQLYKLNTSIPVTGGEWCASEELLKYGGKAVEGKFFFHSFNRASTEPGYLMFKDAFEKRFGYEPGFAAMHAYDCIQILKAALERNGDPTKLRETVRSLGKIKVLQGYIEFDRFGDVTREYYLATVTNGRFVIVKGNE